MLKLSKAQATAVARKIINRVDNDRENNIENYKKELVNSEEYKEMEQIVTDAIPNILKLLDRDINNDEHVSFKIFGSRIYLYNNSCETWKNTLMEHWLLNKANIKFPYTYIREDELVSDIIFESIVSDDITELIEKFANRYGKNNA